MQTTSGWVLTKLKKFGQNQMKTPPNIWKGFIKPTTDPEAPRNARRLNIRKLQKLDGAFKMKPSQSVDVALKVFNNREQQQKKRRYKTECHFSGSSIAALDSQKSSNSKREVSHHWGRKNTFL